MFLCIEFFTLKKILKKLNIFMIFLNKKFLKKKCVNFDSFFSAVFMTSKQALGLQKKKSKSCFKKMNNEKLSNRLKKNEKAKKVCIAKIKTTKFFSTTSLCFYKLQIKQRKKKKTKIKQFLSPKYGCDFLFKKVGLKSKTSLLPKTKKFEKKFLLNLKKWKQKRKEYSCFSFFLCFFYSNSKMFFSLNKKNCF